MYFLELKRMESQPKTAQSSRSNHTLTLLLVFVNVLLLNGWLSPINSLRIDLTADQEFTISEATRKTLLGIDEPLELAFYSTSKTHEKLKPLIPQVRDTLTEYASIGGNKVRLKFADPFQDKALEEELSDLYNIKSEPLPVIDQNSRGIANVYFHTRTPWQPIRKSELRTGRSQYRR